MVQSSYVANDLPGRAELLLLLFFSTGLHPVRARIYWLYGTPTDSFYEGVDLVSVPMPPLLCIPTTAGTAADVSRFAIILDSVNLNKSAIISKRAFPDFSLIDPDTAWARARYEKLSLPASG